MQVPKRSKDVEQIIGNKQAAYDEIFKTRTKVIDDRPQTPNYRKQVNSPNAFTQTQQKDKVKEHISFDLDTKELDSLDHDLSQLLNSQSEVFTLPQFESKYLDQYQLDIQRLQSLESKVDKLSAKMKQVRAFIKDKLKEEEMEYIASVVKIQAWYRGQKARKILKLNGIIISKNMDKPLKSKTNDDTDVRILQIVQTKQNIRINELENTIEALNLQNANHKLSASAQLEIIKSLKDENISLEALVETMKNNLDSIEARFKEKQLENDKMFEKLERQIADAKLKDEVE